jgi:hypothetical protein
MDMYKEMIENSEETETSCWEIRKDNKRPLISYKNQGYHTAVFLWLYVNP